jgi:hypothetical protein
LRIHDFALFQKQNISVPYFGNISQKAEQKCPILGKNSQNRTKLLCFRENSQNRTKLFCFLVILRTEQNCSVSGRNSMESKRILWNLRYFRESKGILGCREFHRILEIQRNSEFQDSALIPLGS